MSRVDGILRCDGCGVEIQLSPVKVNQQEFCCVDCSHGLACDCAKNAEMEDAWREQNPGNLPGPAGYDL